MVRPRIWSRRAATPLALAFVLLAALAAGARSAHAQATQSNVPPPIGTRALDDYAALLRLSPQQRSALTPLHDLYRAEYEELRKSDIEAFLVEQRRVQAAGLALTRDEFTAVMDGMLRIEVKVGLIDRRFFDRVAPLLTDEQAARLPSVRLARDRARYAAGNLEQTYGTPIADLSLAVARLDLAADPAVREAIDARVGPYERRLTALQKRAFDANEIVFERMFDAIEGAGLLGKTQEELLQNPEVFQQLMGAIREIWTDASAEGREAMSDIVTLNRRTFREFAGFLPVSEARRLRSAWFEAGYAELSLIDTQSPTAVWTRAATIPDLTDAEREAVQAGLAAAWEQEMTALRPLLDRIDEARSTFNPMEFDFASMQEFQAEIAEERQKLETTIDMAETQVAGVLGDDWSERARSAVVETVAVPTVPTETDADVDDRSDRLAPRRLTRREVTRLIRALELTADDPETEVIRLLHDEYVTAARGLPARVRANELIADLWSPAEDEAPLEQMHDDLQAAREAVMRDLIARDAMFYDDVAAAIGATAGPDADTIAFERKRRAFGRAMSVRSDAWFVRGGGDATVNVLDVLDDAELAEASRAVMRPMVEDYLAQGTELATRSWRTGMALEQASQRWQRALLAGDDAAMSPAVRDREYLGPATRANTEVATALNALNMQTFEAITAALDGAEQITFVRAWNAAAYPRVYADPIDLAPAFEAAMRIRSLTTDQQDALLVAAAEFRTEYDALSESMVELLRAQRFDFANVEELDIPNAMATNEELERLSFERNEVCLRAARELATILDEGQLAAIGPLPDPDLAVTVRLW